MQQLKLSKDTIHVLKNFNTINSSIYFRKGNRISTRSVSKTILATYNCLEEFDSDFGIYKLDKFLSLLSFFDEPDIEIYEKHLLVKSNKHEAKVTFADPSVLVYPTKDSIQLPSIDITLKLDHSHINAIIKSFSVMDLPEIAFVGDGSSVTLVALNSEQEHGDTYKIEVGRSDKMFKAIFKVSNLKLIPAPYDVEISSKGIAKFCNDGLLYWIAVEKNSSF